MRKIAIGEFSFETIIKDKNFYVDKTLFIEEYLTNASEVTLITRPRRFGKSLTLDMLDRFLNINLDSKELFKDLNIEKHQDVIDKYMNKYPVIHLDFKGLTDNTYDGFIKIFQKNLSNLYKEYNFLLDGNILKEDALYFKSILNQSADLIEIKNDALKLLTELIYKHYKIKPIVIIDEYDMPLEKAYANGYYKEAVNMISPFLGNALKGNEYLEKALLVGCSKVAQAGIFSGLNNLDVYTLLEETYSQYFGFTEKEVKEALEEYKLNDKFDEVKYWYDGYNIGGTSIYNPWSITKYLNQKKFKPYWVNTGSNLFIKGLLSQIDYSDILTKIVNNEIVLAGYTEQIDYNMDKLGKSEILSLLYQAGYLTMVVKNRFKAVNNEVRITFEQTFTQIIQNDNKVPKYLKTFFENIVNFNIKEATKDFEEAISKTTYMDKEAYYYSLLDQMSHAIGDMYSSYREHVGIGGRSDFILKSKESLSDAYIIEVKKISGNNITNEKIKLIIKEALEQIEEKKYAYHLELEGYECIHKVALVIYQNEVYIRFKNNVEYEQLYSKILDFIV